MLMSMKPRCLPPHQFLLSVVPKANLYHHLVRRISHVVAADSIETRAYNKHGVINWSFMVGDDTD